MIVKFSTIGGGVWIEVREGAEEYSDTDRCFRFNKSGNAEWATLGSLKTDHNPRWFGHQFTAKDFIFC